MGWLLRVSLLLIVFAWTTDAGCVEYYQRESRYNTKCGLFGWKKCTRYRYHQEARCCANWRSMPTCNEPKCWNSWGWCPNAGTCTRPDYCECDDNHYSPKCDHCTLIANCLNDQYHCTTSSDQTCKKCEHQYGGDINAYLPKTANAIPNRICEKQCSWRADSSQCYPGTCSGSTTTCACAANFTGTDCMSISNKPDITYCYGRVSMMEGATEKEYIEADCHDLAATTVYTNIKANWIQADWKTRYLGPAQTDYPRPYYISDYVVGVTGMQVDWSLTSPTGTPSGRTVRQAFVGPPVETGSIACSGSLSKDTPGAALHECDKGEDINATITHGQVLSFHVKSQNGGYLSTYDYDTGSQRPGRKEYYTGSWQDHQASFTFDFVNPAHCAPSSGCTDNMLDRGPAFTKQGSFKVRWAGWTDDLSDIKQYEIEVYKLTVYGDMLAYKGQEPVAIHTFPNEQDGPREQDIMISNPGMYCILLVVTDVAGNHELARRFLLFDDVNGVNISQHDSEKMWAPSAAANTSYQWITTLDENVLVQWDGHFYNEFHRTHKLLIKIDDHAVPLAAGYEERTGQPPSTRSMEAIPNVHGIVHSYAVFRVDHQGGRSITTTPASGEFTKLSDVQWESEEWSVSVPRDDGDSVRVWVRAEDVMGNSAVDQILLHVDASPPIVEDIWINRNGTEMLAVHFSKDLFDLRFDLTSFDYHSGLHTLAWELHDTLDSSVVHGDGHVAVRRETTPDLCAPPTCYCIPKDNECYHSDFIIEPDFNKLQIPHGDHDFDYFLQITATNNAQLQTTVKFKISIDVSPPVAGVVHDGPPPADVDHQQDFTLHASWHGFFDRESGVSFYQYGFADHCLPAEYFHDPAADDQVSDTLDTYAESTAPGPGIYYCTVVAYNAAREPSIPVCSDGVTIDNTAPMLYSISVDGVRLRAGLIRENNGAVWFLNTENERWLVEDPVQTCVDSARLVQDIRLIPIKTFKDKREEKQIKETTNCTEYGPAGSPYFLSTENHLSVMWYGEDEESDIQWYQVGLGSSFSSYEDVMPYQGTSGHRHFITYHPGLTDGEQFFIHVKARNGAGLETVKSVGPIVVKPHAPLFSGTLQLTVPNNDEDNESFLSTWSMADFDNDDIDTGYIKEIKYAIQDDSTTKIATDYTPVDDSLTAPQLCTWTEPPTCLAIPLSSVSLSVHSGHRYRLQLLVESVTGLSRVITSDWYQRGDRQPVAGTVIELDLQEAGGDDPSYDIDTQSNRTYVLVEWYGFTYATAGRLELGLGSQPGSDDIISFTEQTATEQGTVMLAGVNLQDNQTVYTVVCVTPDAGQDPVLVSSDGITVLPVDGALEFIVNDGRRCRDEASSSTLDLSHHDAQAFTHGGCGEDEDYGSSRSTFSSFWGIPDYVKAYIVTVEWSLQQRVEDGSWQDVRDWMDLGLINFHTELSLHLTAGALYRCGVKLCHRDGCYAAIYSDGLTLYPDPPALGSIISASMDLGGMGMEVQLEVEEEMSPAYSISWALSSHQEQFTRWNTVQGWTTTGDNDTYMVDFHANFPSPLEVSSCIELGLMVYNPAGLISMLSSPLAGCAPGDPQPLKVIDAVGKWIPGDDDTEDGHVEPIILEKNDYWPEPDREVTGSRTQLSAAWPTLRHGHFSWKVLVADDPERVAFQPPTGNMNYETYHCASPEVLVCGETNENFINVGNLPLQEGHRYHVCIYAAETDVEFETFTQHLESVSACSNGIVPDWTPPIAADVWLGDHKAHQFYQTNPHELRAYWGSFTDVEEHGGTGYHSGIQSYQVAVGSSPYGVDVVAFHNVGLTNVAVLSSLAMQDGKQYYATVKGTDYVGRSTSATSLPVTIESSAPVVTGVQILAHFDVLSDSHTTLRALWEGVFNDTESGVAEYWWCVGSHPGYCDIVAMDNSMGDDPSEDAMDPDIMDGHHCFVSVMAVNGAGLSSSVSSAAILKDSSPPSVHAVYEVVEGEPDKDIDYQASTTSLSVRVVGVHEPHSVIAAQYFSLGTCKGCDDVIAKYRSSITNELMVDGLSLIPGQVYYSSVSVCNSLGLCNTLVSDGVIPDPTAPHPGILRHGLPVQGSLGHQSSRDHVKVHWMNAYDSESGVAGIEVMLGLSPGADDVLLASFLHVATDGSATLILTSPLDEGTEFYATMRVTNNAGLTAETSTQRIIIDSTAPVFTTTPHIDTTFGSLVTNTQILLSSVHVAWEVTDTGGYIVEQYISLTPTDDAISISTPTVKVSGSERHHIFSNVSLADGHSFSVHVTACDASHLCTEDSTEEILVDNSPPHVGAFAVRTEHAAEHQRHRSNWMTYSTENGISTLHLSWLAFIDPHSDISSYIIKVSTEVGVSDLLPVDHVIVGHVTEDPHEDEGFVQKHQVQMNRALQPDDEIIVSVQATNGVGLLSEWLVGRLIAVPSGEEGMGTLFLVRRCDIHTCHGHCTCAPHGHLYCDDKETCTESPADVAPLTVVDVVSLIPLTTVISSTHSQCTLMARWSLATPLSGDEPVWLEWSVSVAGASPGQAMMEPAWRDVWHEDGKVAIFTTESSHVDGVQLQSHVTYIFHVRAWYDSQRYAVFTSNGIQTDSLPPELSSSRKVKEMSAASSPADTDFLAQTDELTVTWNNVFRDAHTDILTYEVSIGLYPGGKDILTEVMSDSARSKSWDVTDLQTGVEYYSSVTATNSAGLFSVAHGDGFLIDSTPPFVGSARDGLGLHDFTYSSDGTMVSVSLAGFSDPESGIARYEWCVGSTRTMEDDLIPCMDIGLSLQASQQLDTTVLSGSMVYSTIYAVNGAGLRSASVKSNGVTIDTSWPDAFCTITYGYNTVLNADFAQDLGIGWTHNDLVVETDSTGARYVTLGTGDFLAQTVVTITPLSKYRVTILARAGNLSASESHLDVQMPEHRQTVMLRRSGNDWSATYLYFLAETTTSALRLSVSGRQSRVKIKKVSVEVMTCDDAEAEAGGSMDVHVHHHTREWLSHVTATWLGSDLESPIREYKWAIGSTQGGTQVMDFQSTGTLDHGWIDDVYLQHGSSIYVTVVAYNAAGLHTTVRSSAVIIDKTPPHLCCVRIAQGEGESQVEVAYITSGDVMLLWEVEDPETGLQSCQYSVGHAPYSSNVLGSTSVPSSSGSGSVAVNLGNEIDHGDTLFFSVTCSNTAGLHSSITSSPVCVVTRPADVTGASLYVISAPSTRFPARQQHQADNSSVTVGWSGVQDISGLQYHEVKVTSGDADVTDWMHVTGSGVMFTRLTGLALLADQTYDIVLRSVNNAGLTSDPISTPLTVLLEPPTTTGVALTATWPQEWIMELDWSDSFTEPSQLIYQVDIGTHAGGNDVLAWTETDVAQLRVTGVDSNNRHYVTITAINMAGLYTTMTVTVDYQPPTQ